MNEDDLKSDPDALAALFERATELTREPIDFDDAEIAEVNTEN